MRRRRENAGGAGEGVTVLRGIVKARDAAGFFASRKRKGALRAEAAGETLAVVARPSPLAALEALKKSLLHQACTGQL